MKKHFWLYWTFLTTSVCAWADPVDLTKAREIAQVYTEGNHIPEAVESPVSKRGMRKDHSPLYIFNRGEGNGFVIVSGDDCLPPVLGYTEQGDFNAQTLPPTLLEWIEGYSRIIEEAQAQGAKPRVLKRAASDKESIRPLVSAHWAQGAPYNNLCPFLNNGGGRAVTGCGATAAAQVIYYWRKELPDRTQYDTPTYGYGDAPVIESFPKGTPLQWELMQDSYDGSTPEDMNTAVATLMSVTGTSTWLTYGSSTSGQISDLVNTFSGQFHLNSRCTYKSGYSQQDWEDMIYDDLIKGWPIVYSGVHPTQGGHAVVVDGYDATNNLFHFNFGWGGGGDGYFTVDDQTGMNGFNTWQGMTHTIHPYDYALEGKIKTEAMQTRMKNTIEVEITNHGTTDYKGIYLAIERKEEEPTDVSDANLRDVNTVIPSGETANVELTYRPSIAGPYYMYLMDSNARILARLATEASAQEPALSLNGLRLDAAPESEETSVVVGGQENTILYNKVYSDAACVRASITNAQEATAATPTLQCDLYQYDAGQSAFVKRGDLSDRETVFAEGSTQEVTFNFDDMEKDVLYAAALHRDYKAGGEDRTMEAAPKDTIVYFKVAGCDLTMAETDNRGAVFSGHWNRDKFLELASTVPSAHFDLTRVTGIDSVPQLANPNILFYLDVASEAKGKNIIKEGICEELSLTMGYDYYAQQPFTARRAVFNPQSSSMKWQYIALPFDCEVPEGSRARRIKKLSNILISESDEVNTTLKACTPYLYRTTRPGEDRITATDVTVDDGHGTATSDTLSYSFSNGVARKGLRMLNKADIQTFVEDEGATIPAFSGYLTYDKDVSTNIYAYEKKDKESEALGELLNQAYLLAENAKGQLSPEDLNTFLDQIHTAAACYTRHPEAEEIAEAAALLEEGIKACRRNLIPTDAPIDLTDVYLTNASFESRRTTGWDITRETGQSSKVTDVSSLDNYMVDADGSYVFHSYSSSGKGSVTLSQKATGLKNGFYRVKAWIATDEGQSVTFFANEATATMTDDGFGGRYLRETVIDSIHVTDGMLTLGIKGNDGWYKADNFRLYYLGDGTTSVTPVRKGTATVKAYGGEGYISLQGLEGQVLTVSIYGTDGRIVRQVTVDGQEQVRGLSKGLYIVDRQKVIVR
mgnify:CR=1 FL=1